MIEDITLLLMTGAYGGNAFHLLLFNLLCRLKNKCLVLGFYLAVSLQQTAFSTRFPSKVLCSK